MLRSVRYDTDIHKSSMYLSYCFSYIQFPVGHGAMDMSVWQNSPAVMLKCGYSDGTYPCAGSNAIRTHRISSLSMIRTRKFSISGSPELPRSAMRAPLSLYHMPPRSLSHASVSFESVISNCLFFRTIEFYPAKVHYTRIPPSSL